MKFNKQISTLLQNPNQNILKQTTRNNLQQDMDSIIQEKRKVSVIQTSVRGMQKYHKRIRGERSQTKQLNIHMKTLNQKYLKQCLMANELQEEDKIIYNKYKEINANFQSTKFLFQSISPQVKEEYRNYTRSSHIVKDILQSDRMFINNKIIFIKFLKKVESGIDIPNESWKSLYFHKKNQTNNPKNEQQKNTIEKEEKKVFSQKKQQKNKQKGKQSLKVRNKMEKLNIIVQNNYKTSINININNWKEKKQWKQAQEIKKQQNQKKKITISTSSMKIK